MSNNNSSHIYSSYSFLFNKSNCGEGKFSLLYSLSINFINNEENFHTFLNFLLNSRLLHSVSSKYLLSTLVSCYEGFSLSSFKFSFYYIKFNLEHSFILYINNSLNSFSRIQKLDLNLIYHTTSYSPSFYFD